MSEILCVTNRTLCRGDFFERIEKIAAAKPAGIILREKDLNEKEYMELASEVMKICRKYNTQCILHTFINVARAMNADAIHLPMPILMQLEKDDIAQFSIVGASCHSIEEASAAEKKGCGYIVAGHVFDTECKKGLPGRGLTFIKKVREGVSIPVYGIGGICPENIADLEKTGVKGVCVMSSIMTTENVSEYLNGLQSTT